MEWCALFCSKSVVIRGLKYALVVGSILIAINHGDALIHGDLDRVRVLKIVLTVLVPYCVSALSSVGAMRQMKGQGEAP